MALQASDVLSEFEFGIGSAPWMIQNDWVNKWTNVDLRTAYKRSQLFYFAFDRDNPSAPQYFGHVLGRGDSFIRVVQDGLNALASQVLPFSYGIVQPTGVYDCSTAALATIARYWYRHDIALPLPSTSELQWPELLLAFQTSPAMQQAVAERWRNPSVRGTNIPAYYQFKWILPDPARQYFAPPMPPGCSSMRPEVQGFFEMAETPGTGFELPPIPEIPEPPPGAAVEQISVTPQEQPSGSGWKNVAIALSVGAAGLLLWSIVKEK